MMNLNFLINLASRPRIRRLLTIFPQSPKSMFLSIHCIPRKSGKKICNGLWFVIVESQPICFFSHIRHILCNFQSRYLIKGRFLNEILVRLSISPSSFDSRTQILHEDCAAKDVDRIRKTRVCLLASQNIRHRQWEWYFYIPSATWINS